MKAQQSSPVQAPIARPVNKQLQRDDREVIDRFYQQVIKSFGHFQHLKKVG